MVTEAPPVDAAPHESREGSAVPSDWLDTHNEICPRCDRYIGADIREAHDYGHDVADARLRGETLTTPTRMVVATNQQAGIKQDGTPAKTGWRPST